MAASNHLINQPDKSFITKILQKKEKIFNQRFIEAISNFALNRDWKDWTLVLLEQIDSDSVFDHGHFMEQKLFASPAQLAEKYIFIHYANLVIIRFNFFYMHK